jgi:hypothetical protein
VNTLGNRKRAEIINAFGQAAHLTRQPQQNAKVYLWDGLEHGQEIRGGHRGRYAIRFANDECGTSMSINSSQFAKYVARGPVAQDHLIASGRVIGPADYALHYEESVGWSGLGI